MDLAKQKNGLPGNRQAVFCSFWSKASQVTRLSELNCHHQNLLTIKVIFLCFMCQIYKQDFTLQAFALFF
jgi:hypothetical protein